MQRSRGLFSFKKLAIAIVGGFISFLRLVVLWADNGPTIIDLCTALHLHAPAHRIVGARTTNIFDHMPIVGALLVQRR